MQYERALFLSVFILLFPGIGMAQAMKRDIFETSKGDLEIYFVGHASLIFEYRGKTIHIDPTNMVGDYSKLPKADLVFITHEHGDHFDPKALEQISRAETTIVTTPTVAQQCKNCIVMQNGDRNTIEGLPVEAVPAYNIVHERTKGIPFHPKGIGNGYVITFGDMRVYIAGDTENIPEMKALKSIHIAFLPMNVPYTMTPEMVADATKSFNPKILYPYHFSETDTSRIVDLLKNEKVEVRIRDMK
jgi:L-ascorbate metabolism protein UlaG (beta-lactamase superfamily)